MNQKKKNSRLLEAVLSSLIILANIDCFASEGPGILTPAGKKRGSIIHAKSIRILQDSIYYRDCKGGPERRENKSDFVIFSHRHACLNYDIEEQKQFVEQAIFASTKDPSVQIVVFTPLVGRILADKHLTKLVSTSKASILEKRGDSFRIEFVWPASKTKVQQNFEDIQSASGVSFDSAIVFPASK